MIKLPKAGSRPQLKRNTPWLWWYASITDCKPQPPERGEHWSIYQSCNRRLSWEELHMGVQKGALT